MVGFKKFNGSFDEVNYQEAPSDWWVIICDVEGSTRLVKESKYKEINIIGAACICAVDKIGDFPAAFGGDGASFLVDGQLKEEVVQELLKVKNAAAQRYGFNLRVGAISLRDIRARGLSVKVAKYELSKDRFIAKFAGGGIEFADELIKRESSYQIKEQVSLGQAGFDNLSCRWEPIESSRGIILTLMVKAPNFKVYKEIIENINTIAGEEASLNPVKTKSMSYKSFYDLIKEEWNFDENFMKRFFRFCEISLCFLLFNKFRDKIPKALSKYILSMERYSDFRKFDDTLRMVIDCRKEDSVRIQNYLSNFHGISFGCHESQSALMTCFVKNIRDGGHIHFIDGSGGGYTQAAKRMKNVYKKTA